MESEITERILALESQFLTISNPTIAKILSPLTLLTNQSSFIVDIIKENEERRKQQEPKEPGRSLAEQIQERERELRIRQGPSELTDGP